MVQLASQRHPAHASSRGRWSLESRRVSIKCDRRGCTTEFEVPKPWSGVRTMSPMDETDAADASAPAVSSRPPFSVQASRLGHEQLAEMNEARQLDGASPVEHPGDIDSTTVDCKGFVYIERRKGGENYAPESSRSRKWIRRGSHFHLRSLHKLIHRRLFPQVRLSVSPTNRTRAR